MKSYEQVVLVSLFLLLFCGSLSSEIVQIDDGQIEGTTMTSRMGKSFHAFLRIPFAEPPLIGLRFEPPLPVIPWSGIHNGTYYGPQCYQSSPRPGISMSEDCLQLNVFTTSLTELKPVIVFIHGGAFSQGTAVNHGPQNLLDREIVLVTINYRLGALGFLATGTKESPGNVGMKDQALALKWVQKNIEKFGGDKTKVTVGGYSAGSFAVTALMASPMAKGTFHSVIAMSGAITGLKPLRKEYLDQAKSLANQLHCSSDNVADMIACLRTKTPLEIVTVELRAYPDCQVGTWRLVIETNFGQEQFLLEDPIELTRSGNFAKVPILMGRTTDEFINLVPNLLNNPTRLQQLNDNFDELAPYCFAYEAGTERSHEFGKLLRSSYLPFDKIDARSFNGLNNLFGDGIIGYGVHKFAHLASNHTKVFYYKLSYIGRFSVFNYPHNKPYGVHHGDDLQYVFYVPTIGSLVTPTDPEHFMVERMTKIFEQFALTGNPNYDDLVWPEHNSSNEFYMDIGTHMIEKNGLFLERYSVWDRFETSSAVVSSLKIFFLLLSVALSFIS